MYACRGLLPIVREVSAIRGRSCVASERRSDSAPDDDVVVGRPPATGTEEAVRRRTPLPTCCWSVPAWYGPRLRMLGNIVATERGLSNDDVVAAFAAGYKAYKSRSSAATSPPRRWWRGATTTTTTRPRPCDCGRSAAWRPAIGRAGWSYVWWRGPGRLYKGQLISATYS